MYCIRTLICNTYGFGLYNQPYIPPVINLHIYTSAALLRGARFTPTIHISLLLFFMVSELGGSSTLVSF